MRVLYHLWLSPFSRKVRIVLSEKNLDFTHEPAKEWYARIKSRPSFRPILADHVPGVPPPAHYADLDF